jgi:hypothetical protein
MWEFLLLTSYTTLTTTLAMMRCTTHYGVGGISRKCTVYIRGTKPQNQCAGTIQKQQQEAHALQASLLKSKTCCTTDIVLTACSRDVFEGTRAVVGCWKPAVHCKHFTRWTRPCLLHHGCQHYVSSSWGRGVFIQSWGRRDIIVCGLGANHNWTLKVCLSLSFLFSHYFQFNVFVKIVLSGYWIQRALASARTLCPFPEYCPVFQGYRDNVSGGPDI